jgi:phosphatidylserine synthase
VSISRVSSSSLEVYKVTTLEGCPIPANHVITPTLVILSVAKDQQPVRRVWAVILYYLTLNTRVVDPSLRSG